MITIYPALMCNTKDNIVQLVQQLDQYCSGFHIDIMDNSFVPNNACSLEVTHVIDNTSIDPVWVHLMVNNPLPIIKKLSIKKKSIISFHIEAVENIDEVIAYIKLQDYIPSIALNPTTEISDLYPWLSTIPHILLMSVQPGFSGQPLLPSTFERLLQLNNYRKKNNLVFTLAIDGGITTDNIAQLITCGAESFAIGSAIIDQQDPVHALQRFIKLCQ